MMLAPCDREILIVMALIFKTLWVVRSMFRVPLTDLLTPPGRLLDGTGMKVLLLDAVTTQVVAMVYSQSQILEKEVYLVERMDADHEPMQHLKAVYFIRPTKENIQTLSTEIARPRFSEYHVFFCSICPNELLQQLAAADEHEGWFVGVGWAMCENLECISFMASTAVFHHLCSVCSLSM